MGRAEKVIQKIAYRETAVQNRKELDMSTPFNEGNETLMGAELSLTCALRSRGSLGVDI
jgi:hypothetical protein